MVALGYFGHSLYFISIDNYKLNNISKFLLLLTNFYYFIMITKAYFRNVNIINKNLDFINIENLSEYSERGLDRFIP